MYSRGQMMTWTNLAVFQIVHDKAGETFILVSAQHVQLFCCYPQFKSIGLFKQDLLLLLARWHYKLTKWNSKKKSLNFEVNRCQLLNMIMKSVHVTMFPWRRWKLEGKILISYDINLLSKDNFSSLFFRNQRSCLFVGFIT